MDEAAGGAAPSAAGERAEELIGRTGQWLGALVRGTLQGVERAATGFSARSSADAEPASDRSADSPAAVRAAHILDSTGERVGHVAALAGHRLRQAAALAREEAEDLWAEAQHLRGQKRQGPE